MRWYTALPTAAVAAGTAVTAYASDRARRKALSAGYDDYVKKPVAMDRLIATITNLAPSRRSDALVQVVDKKRAQPQK